MNVRIGARRLVTALFVYAVLVLPTLAQGHRLRVAVYPFNQANVESNIEKEIGAKVNYGQIAADMLATELASRLDVINRDQMARVLEEQGRKYDERFDPSTAPEFGKLFGVDAIVTGSLTALNVERKDSQGVGEKINSVTNIFNRGDKNQVNTKTSTIEARVELTAQVISTVTGQTLTASSAKGQDKKQVQGSLQVGSANNSPSSSTLSNSGYDPYIRAALQEAVHQVADNFMAGSSVAPWPDTDQQTPTTSTSSTPSHADYTALPDELGNVWRLEAASLSFFVAPGAKLAVGDVLEVQHPDLVMNPRTGRQVAVGQTLGTVKLTRVTPDVAEGAYQGKPVTDKDRVVKKQQ